jgi:transposase
VHQAPERFGFARVRWRLEDLRQCPALPALAAYSLPGIWLLLQRLGIHAKRGRLSLHSPDPQYAEKVFALDHLRALARRFPGRLRLLYADEVGLYRQPTRADRYACGAHEPTAPLTHTANSRWRIGGALDVGTGEVTYVSRDVVGVDALCALRTRLRARYPDQILVLAWDNWPVHRLPRVLATAAQLRIHLRWLPTYAPWTNPIEKLWRWMRQTCVHHHQKAGRWSEFKAEVRAFLDQFADGATDLLRYVGLLPD